MIGSSQTVKWTKLISLGNKPENCDHIVNNPWVRVSNEQKYVIRSGYKSERTVALPDGSIVQLFCEVCKQQNVPLFKCSCPDKLVEVITTTLTQAANSILQKLGVETKKHWSGSNFFGFLRKDVFKYLCIDNEELYPTSENDIEPLVNNPPNSSTSEQQISSIG